VKRAIFHFVFRAPRQDKIAQSGNFSLRVIARLVKNSCLLLLPSELKYFIFKDLMTCKTKIEADVFSLNIVNN